MTRRPCPSLEVKEARGADDHAVLRAYDGERHGGAGIAPRESCFNVRLSLVFSLRCGTPAVELAIVRRSRDQTVNVVRLQRLQADVLALQREIFRGHDSNMR